MSSVTIIELLGSVGASGVAAMLTVAAGAGATYITSRGNKERRRHQNEIRELSKGTRAALETFDQQRSALLSQVLSMVPRGASADELRQAVASAVTEGMSKLEDVTRKQVDVFSELVRGYHTQALGQARVQFYFSIAAASVGFTYIIAVTWLGVSTGAPAASTAVTSIPGIVLEAVAALFFRQSEQTRERATALYDRLRQDNQINAARVMVDSIEDSKMRSLIRGQLALHVAGLKPKEIDIQSLQIEP